jgi:hypothetical protein
MLGILTALLVVITADLIFWERRIDVDKQLASEDHKQCFRGTVKVSDLAYDDRTRSATATLELEVRPLAGSEQIHEVEYAYQTNPEGSSDLVHCTIDMKECFTSYEESAGPGLSRSTLAAIRHSHMSINLHGERAEIWYPFDSFSFVFDFRGSVNPDSQATLPDHNLLFDKLIMQDSEPGFLLRKAGNRYLLVRRPFLHLVSFIFFGLSIVFLYYLLRISDAKDLMGKALGFFGALWALRSLLVPSSIKIFPTVIEYVILTEFCILFTIIVYRVTLSKEDETHEPQLDTPGSLVQSAAVQPATGAPSGKVKESTREQQGPGDKSS